MTTERKSLLAIVLGRLTQGQVPVDGMHFWEPAGALKFTAPKPPTRARKTRETTRECVATAGYQACSL
jgi:hypothetical protein